MIKTNDGVKRLVANANTLEEAIAMVSGGEPLNAREQALVQAATEIFKRESAAKTKNKRVTLTFKHDAEEIYDAIGVGEQYWDSMKQKLDRVMRMMNDDDTNSFNSQSKRLEALMSAFDTDMEAVLAFYMWANGTNVWAIQTLQRRDIEIKALKYEIMCLKGEG